MNFDIIFFRDARIRDLWADLETQVETDSYLSNAKSAIFHRVGT